MNLEPNAAPQGEQEEYVELPPKLQLTISSDKMQLELEFQRQTPNPLKPDYDEVMAAIAAKGVVFGINDIALHALCQNPAYGRSFIIAKGEPSKIGKDGSLHYLVEQGRELRPKLRENGTVDYRDLGFIHNVRKGDPLCEVHKPEKGDDGCDLMGKVIEGRLGKEPRDPQGKNTMYNEDGTILMAAVDGSVEVMRGIVSVVDVMRINGNIDNSTGDIDFVGDVVVNGDVVSGFKVTSQGSISISGSVEGANIDAKGDISVGQGINGMNRGSVVAGGNLKCKYIQSCFVKSGVDIYADSIMYCTLECGGNVELSGKRAVLIGGRSSIMGKLIAKTIGTESHVATHITMASSGTGKHQEILDLGKALKDIDAENIKLLQIMARFEDLMKQGRVDAEQVKGVQRVKEKYLDQVAKRGEIQQRIAQVKQEQLEASRENSYIECNNRIHVGVTIVFGPLTMIVQNSFVHSRVSIIENDIAISTL